MVYLDNCATTKVDKDCSQLALSCMVEDFGNPSSPYYVGAKAFDAINNARSKAAMVIASKATDIYFTPSGTYSNNLAIIGSAKANPSKKHIVTTAIEHDSVLKPCEYLKTQGYKIDIVQPNKNTGRIEAPDVVSMVKEDTLLVSCMTVNNETGEILPIKDIVLEIKSKYPKVLFHTDCVQGFGKLPFKVHDVPVDFLTSSAHKIHGPKGVGLIYVRDRKTITPISYGGKQEGLLNPGTENVPSICAFGLACEKVLYNYKETEVKVKELNHFLRDKLKKLPVEIVFNSKEDEGYSPYVLNFGIKGIQGGDLVKYLSLKEVYVSTGSACTLGKRSHVLEARGLSNELLEGSIRVGFSKETTFSDLEILCSSIKEYLDNKSGAK
ncbi:MAG: cysteine desulfurase [Sphaerochaetaceae bacterium]|nr:cysteine desulfurase [Sphaerochaetaceae bacterium]